MGLSRLDNFLKNARGNILYVNPNDLDSTDSIENQGNSLTRPFKTIQRALIEAARFSYQRGLDNDRFGKTTILLYPGDHIVDNRPGWIPVGSNNYLLRNGTNSGEFSSWSLTTNFDLTSENNELYKLNSIHGGVILPRGTSIVGLDLRKTKIRPKYIPNPENDAIERSSVFRVTGACYLWQFSMFDGDPNGNVYKDYTNNIFVPNFSHHKLSCFEYADGVNPVSINDGFINYSTNRTDLDMYYEKIGLVYGPSSGREIDPDYPASSIDIQAKIDEYRIVGPTGGNVGITSIRSHDGVLTTISTNTITVEIDQPLPGLSVDTGFQVSGVNPEYDGQFVVSEVVSPTIIKYNISNAPSNPSPSSVSATLNLQVDTVTSASPYIFNVSLRSVYGMCGLLADGDKASGFKSMVVAQFTGIGLQKDKNAFIKYNPVTGDYEDSDSIENLNTDSRSVFRPSYRNFHIKTINDAYIQNVSVFAIGFAEHFSSDTGGDQSINNSNSNFGSKSLVSSGFKRSAFRRDDVGYITHIIPPKEIEGSEVPVEFYSIDVNKTIVGVGITNRLYLYGQTNRDLPPDSVIQGYRIGAKDNDTLNLILSQNRVSTEYSAQIVMPNTELSATQVSNKKVFDVGRSAGINSITSSTTFVLTNNHSLLNGESIRVVSEDGYLPDGLDSNRVYYAIIDGLNPNEVQIAQTRNDAISLNPINVNTKGGILHIESRVSDKIAGELGHPLQYDANESQWYLNVGSSISNNTIYSTLVGIGTTSLGESTPRTYIKRTPDNRSLIDTIYRTRYVIPAGSGITSARPPIDGFIIQESSNVIGFTNSEVEKQFSVSDTLSNVNEVRNFKFISNARWDSLANQAHFLTELPHNLKQGSEVEILNVTSSNNTAGIAKSGYNGTFSVAGITSSKGFYVNIATNPGTFANNTSVRTTSLPNFSQKKYKGTYQVYRSQQIQEYIPGQQDGVYHLLIVNNSNSPIVPEFSNERYSQPIQYLYPQSNRDNPKSDPTAANSFALSSQIGIVDIDDPQNSITRENLEKSLYDFNAGVGITFIQSNTAGLAHTIYTSIEHGLNRITKLSIANPGSGYGLGSAQDFYNVNLVNSVNGREATAKVSVDNSGSITDIKIMHGGSAYQVGDTLTIAGIATFAPFVQAQINVDSIYNSVNESISIIGVTPDSNSEFNSVYRITGISSSKEIQVQSLSVVSAASSSGVGITETSNSLFVLNGPSLSVSSLTYNNVTGFGVVTTTQPHGFSVGNKVILNGATNSLYNNSFIISRVNGLNSFDINVGIGTTSPSTTGTIRVYNLGYTSFGGNITLDNENISGRQISEYAGITTTLSSAIVDASTTNINITGVENLNIRIGDYLKIDDEIVRVKQNVTSNPVSVFRGVLGTRSTSHVVQSVVRKINCRPIEFRRNSIIRASGHTFEYLGYGPGNYSTAFPDRQDRILNPQEELLSQSTKKDGGINVYTGMNDKGDFYIGNKKVSSSTGQEEVFDAPIPSVTGEDIRTSGINIGFDVLTPLEASISRSLRVEGGPDKTIISEFDGPVIFNNKVVVNSTKGLESDSLFLQGDANVSRKYTVGISTPTLSGNPGDVVFNSDPVAGESVGWVYTNENTWNEFGPISLSSQSRIGVFDRVGVATNSLGHCTLRVGAGSSLFCVDGNGVGIGTTANNYNLNVEGTANISGALSVGSTLTASKFSGDGSLLFNLPNDSLWAYVPTGIGSGAYPIGNVQVGIGTTIPHYVLEVGSPGTGNIDLYVNNKSQFIGFTTFSDVTVGGAFTSTTFRLDGASSNIRAGVITATTLVVGAALSTLGSQVGLGTAVPRAKLDVEGSAKFKTYSENVHTLTITSGIVDIDLTKAQTFTLSVTSQVTGFNIQNPPTGATSFTIKIQQGSPGSSVNIDNITVNSGSAIPVYWPGGGIVPIVTTNANAIDVYSFMTFDGCSSLYGVVGGQNFANL